MQPDDMRQTLGLSAIAGGLVWGFYHLATTLLAGQPVHRQDLILAAANVACAVCVGVLVAWFTGPMISPMIPLSGLRDPHALGFGIGGLSWELLPVALSWAKAMAQRKAGGGAP